MKRTFFFLAIFLILVGTNCKKEHQFMNNAVIVGFNLGSCSTCGGFYLNLNDDTAINTQTYYVISYSNSLIPLITEYSSRYLKYHLPIYVKVDWKPAKDEIPYAPPNWIRVTDISSR